MGWKSLLVSRAAALLFLLLAVIPAASAEEEIFGGISFVGDREDVCVLIEGECMEESIYFKLDTCDADNNVKEMFRDKTPFTLRVPKGVHRLVIMKEGQKVVAEGITIIPGEILEFQLPNPGSKPSGK